MTPALAIVAIIIVWLALWVVLGVASWLLGRALVWLFELIEGFGALRDGDAAE